MQNNNKLVTILVAFVVVLGTILSVFIANALLPNSSTKAMGLARSNQAQIEVIKKELQIELKNIKDNIQEIKVMLKERR